MTGNDQQHPTGVVMNCVTELIGAPHSKLPSLRWSLPVRNGGFDTNAIIDAAFVVGAYRQ